MQQPIECQRHDEAERQFTSKNSTNNFFEPIRFANEDSMFVKENVVILRTNFLDNGKIEICFVLTKPNIKILNESTIMDSVKVRQALLSQRAPLSRFILSFKNI